MGKILKEKGGDGGKHLGEGDGMNKNANQYAKVEKSRLRLEYCKEISLIVVNVPVASRNRF